MIYKQSGFDWVLFNTELYNIETLYPKMNVHLLYTVSGRMITWIKNLIFSLPDLMTQTLMASLRIFKSNFLTFSKYHF